MVDVKMKRTEVVIVGFGWTGAVMAKELSDAGLEVVALERGVMRDTAVDGIYPGTIDELTYSVRGKLYQNLARETVTIRHNISDSAFPYRQLRAFLPGDGVGGAGLHWSGIHFRVLPEELRLHSHYRERYGNEFMPKDMRVQDFGVTYEELEPYFSISERMTGTSGEAYTVNGKIVGKGNRFAPDRSSDFPLPPLADLYSAELVRKAARDAGLSPYTLPAANASRAYTNPYGCQMGPCTYCGFCSGYACYNYSKASPNVNVLPALRQKSNFELRSESHVIKINLDDGGKRAIGVTYIDASGRLIEQPADLVLVCSFSINNVRLLLLSGIGNPYDPISQKGTVGKNFTYQNNSHVNLILDKKRFTNPFVGAGATGVGIDDFNGDNFDHGPLKFVGGASINSPHGGVKAIGEIAIPSGAPHWGSQWKKAVRESYAHSMSIAVQGASMPYRDCYLDLDPDYRDKAGQPLLRMTFDWKDNDTQMMQYVTDQVEKFARSINPIEINTSIRKLGAHFDTRQYQSTHLNGGAIMGADPSTSVINKYSQVWEIPNVFVYGASSFPVGLAYNPTGLVLALTYFSAAAIKEKYVKSPHSLIST